MSRMYRYATIGIIWIIAVICHWFGVVYFAPGGELYFLAADGIGTFVDSGWRTDMYRVFAMYLPMIFIGGSLLWGFAAEYDSALFGRRYP